MHIYICIYIYACFYIYIHVSIYIYIYIYIYTCIALGRFRARTEAFYSTVQCAGSGLVALSQTESPPLSSSRRSGSSPSCQPSATNQPHFRGGTATFAGGCPD